MEVNKNDWSDCFKSTDDNKTMTKKLFSMLLLVFFFCAKTTHFSFCMTQIYVKCLQDTCLSLTIQSYGAYVRKKLQNAKTHKNKKYNLKFYFICKCIHLFLLLIFKRQTAHTHTHSNITKQTIQKENLLLCILYKL